MRAFVTGSNGLIGRACVRRLLKDGWEVVGIDSDSRAAWFGCSPVKPITHDRYDHYDCRIHDVFQGDEPVWWSAIGSHDLFVHCAAMPSHDYSAGHVLETWDTNATQTVRLLEFARTVSPKATFVFMSTNKVYGMNGQDETRYAIDCQFDECQPVDQTSHSPFGVSKLAADLMVQEYGLYFGMNTCCLRLGCVTGPDQQGVELHGFLSHIAKCVVSGVTLNVFGSGRQVRDILHADDVADFVVRFHDDPNRGEVYNLGGGSENCDSLNGYIQRVEDIVGRRARTKTHPTRQADHEYWVTDYLKANHDYGWQPTHSIDDIVRCVVTQTMEQCNGSR